ncbi:VSK-int [Vibrio crassostreae]|nr:VSK-int [Vibrio crassostreae]CAK2510850.1 VSK-int [Vibrio crassostreae]CAK2532617.1 VSK-int [Vibrio crassostreae]CAK2913160.1 VSK-int [Vibrio crassostreae]CAK2913907.1 VSK-int [Vibrio crassostreae]
MANKVMGIARKQYPTSKNNESFYELVILRPIDNVDVEKYKKEGFGFDTEVPYGKEPLKINPVYAVQLLSSGAFVPDREYDFVVGCNPDDVYEQWIAKLIPVDDEIKKHFEASLKK